jgi:hypothetical protein
MGTPATSAHATISYANMKILMYYLHLHQIYFITNAAASMTSSLSSPPPPLIRSRARTWRNSTINKTAGVHLNGPKQTFKKYTLFRSKYSNTTVQNHHLNSSKDLQKDIPTLAFKLQQLCQNFTDHNAIIIHWIYHPKGQ